MLLPPFASWPPIPFAAASRNTYPTRTLSRPVVRATPIPRLYAATPAAFPAAARAPFPLCITRPAIEQLMATVGSRPPESGAKAFGPPDRFGIDTIEFDERGSSRATGGVYSPDTEWGDARCAHWLGQPDELVKVWTGDIHSHPGDFNHPSQKSGEALGDLGYAEAVFARNEAMQYFAIPIVTRPGSDAVLITPWLVCRDAPLRPMLADLAICEVAEFPPRVFNPAWERALAAPATEQAPTPLSIDVDHLAAILGRRPRALLPAEGAGLRLEFDLNAGVLCLQLGPLFPASPPEVTLFLAGEEHPHRPPFRWRRRSERRPERRLADLYRAVIEAAHRQF